jgi:tetratricopeptide (TPR) repeat protein
LAQKELNAKSAEVIRGKEFKVASKYYLYRIKLAERIIQSLVSFESSKVSALSFIRRAVTMDAVELADKALSEEMLKAQEKEDFATLRYLYDFAHELEQDYNFKFSYNKKLMPRGEVRHLDEVQHTLEELLVQIRNYFRQSPESRRMGASVLSSRLEEIEPETHKAAYTYEKVRVGISLLSIDNRDTDHQQKPFELQRGLVQKMLTRKENYSITRLSKEIANLVSLAEHVGDKETAIQYTLTFSQLNPKTLIEQKEFTKSRIVQTISVGEFWANLSLAEKGLQELEETRFQFDNRELARSFLKLGLNFFYHEEYSQALSCFQEVRSIPGKDWGRVTWEPDTLVLLCNLELGNTDVIDSLARSVYRNTKKYDSEYPKMVARIMNWVVKSNASDRKRVFEKGLEEIRGLSGANAEIHNYPFFDFSIWLEAKLKGTTQAELFTNIGKLRYQRDEKMRWGT